MEISKIYRRFFVYFWIISVILLGLASMGIRSILSPPDSQRVFSLANVSETFNGDEQMFLNQAEKVLIESPDFLLIQKNSLQAASPVNTFSPQVLGALVAGVEPRDNRKIIVEYIVQAGDNLRSISDNFDVSLKTLLWANDLTEESLILVGQELVIPPVSGIIHHVKSGDTVGKIAQRYKGKVSEIVAFNNLSNEADIFIGDILIVPNGLMPQPAEHFVPQQIPLASKYFICPISLPCRVTQGLHWYNAIDFSHGQCGAPIFAAAGGQVLKVRLTNSTSRWAFGGAGNHLTILHPNGVVTMYGHISTSLVSPGQKVSQGQRIALMGGRPGTPGAGKSTGCHLHFGVHGARNPFVR